MNTIISCIKKIFSNLLCTAFLVALLISWRAAVLYRNNLRQISVIEAEKKRADRDFDEVIQKIELQKQKEEQLKKKLRETGPSMNPVKGLFDLVIYSGHYVQNDINGYLQLKDFIDAWSKTYIVEKKLTIARGKLYLNFWEEEFRNHALNYLIGVLLAVFVAPFLIAFCIYYGVAKVVEMQKPEHDRAEPTGSPLLKMADARVSCTLSPPHHLYLRAGWCKERKNILSRTKLLWRWRYPLVSCIADLCELVDFYPEKDREGEVMITAPIEDLFIGKIDLNGGELILRPRFLVGVTDDVTIRTRWDFSVHSIFSGRIRKIILGGSGTIFLAGSWGVDQQVPQAGEDHRIETKMLLGYDRGAEYALCRTETFWHYFRGQTELFDIRIAKGVFLTQNNAWSAQKEPSNMVDGILKFLLDGFFSILGL